MRGIFNLVQKSAVRRSLNYIGKTHLILDLSSQVGRYLYSVDSVY